MATLTSVFTSIANAIRGKNGSSDTYTPEEMATAISEIETGIDTSDATATAGDILATKTAYAVGEKVTGNMTNNGAVSPSGLNCGGSYTIPAGYHNGSGKVIANSLASQTTPASGKTAVGAGQMLTGYSGWVNGSQVNGTMANNGTVSPSGLNCGGSYTIPAGYHSGSGKVTANSLASQTKPASGKTAISASQVLTGYSGWVNGSQINGVMANNGSFSKTGLLPGNSYSGGAGYYSGVSVSAANYGRLSYKKSSNHILDCSGYSSVDAGQLWVKGVEDGVAEELWVAISSAADAFSLRTFAFYLNPGNTITFSATDVYNGSISINDRIELISSSESVIQTYRINAIRQQTVTYTVPSGQNIRSIKLYINNQQAVYKDAGTYFIVDYK